MTITNTAIEIERIKLLKSLDYQDLYRDIYEGQLMVLYNEVKHLLRRK